MFFQSLGAHLEPNRTRPDRIRAARTVPAPHVVKRLLEICNRCSLYLVPQIPGSSGRFKIKINVQNDSKRPKTWHKCQNERKPRKRPKIANSTKTADFSLSHFQRRRCRGHGGGGGEAAPAAAATAALSGRAATGAAAVAAAAAAAAAAAPRPRPQPWPLQRPRAQPLKILGRNQV